MKNKLTTYQKLCAEFYDLEPHPLHNAALEFYKQEALAANGPILEPMCGTGRFLIPLAEMELDIEGFDASLYMLNALKRKYAQISQKTAPVWQEFVQDFKRDKLYNLIFVPYGSWGLITNVEDSKRGLSRLYEHLAPGGKLLLEIETVASAPKPERVWRKSVSFRADGSQMELNAFTYFDTATQIFTSLCHYKSLVEEKVTETETENFQQYLYHFNEMDQLLQLAQFKKVKKYSDYAKNPAQDTKAHLIIYECTK